MTAAKKKSKQQASVISGLTADLESHKRELSDCKRDMVRC